MSHTKHTAKRTRQANCLVLGYKTEMVTSRDTTSSDDFELMYGWNLLEKKVAEKRNPISHKEVLRKDTLFLLFLVNTK